MKSASATPEELQLAAPPSAALTAQSPSPSAPPTVGQMLGAVIEKGVTTENVAAIEKLVDLYERMELRNAQKEFAAAFVALQSEMPKIVAVKAVPNNDGTIRYKFAPYEDIMEQVRPLTLRHGFSISFVQSFTEGRITETCKLQHIGGHVEQHPFSVRIGKGPPGSSEAQGDGAASTYAKRHALCNALNIVIEQDSDGFDAKKDGKPIAPDQALYLKELVTETKSDVAGFLKFAGAPSFEEIGAARYDDLVRALHKKKRATS